MAIRNLEEARTHQLGGFYLLGACESDLKFAFTLCGHVLLDRHFVNDCTQ